MDKLEQGLSPRLLEGIVRGEVIEPRHLDIKYEADEYIMGFCSWQEFVEKAGEDK